MTISHLKIPILIGLVAFFTYSRGLFNGFVFDDYIQVLGNHWITSPRYLPEIFSSDIAGFMGDNFHYYRPLVLVCHMACYLVFGPHAWGFHLVSIMLHVGNSVLIYAVISRLLRNGDAAPPDRPYLAAGAALLFAVHPIHAEPVLYVSAVGDLLCTLFVLIAFLMHLRWSESGKTGIPWLGSVAFGCALLCKETAVVLPLVLMLQECLVRGRVVAVGTWWRRWFPYMAVTALYVTLRWEVLGVIAPNAVSDISVTAVIRLFGRYIAKLVVPLRLNEYYHSAGGTSGPVPAIVGSLLLLLAVLSLGAFLYIRQRKMALFGLLAMVLPLLPALYVSGYSWSGYAERYLYLPSVGFALVVGDLMGALLCFPLKQYGRLMKVGLSCMIALGIANNIRMGHVWKDESALWADTVRKSPRNPDVRIGYARSLEEMGREEEAARQYEAARALAEELSSVLDCGP